MTIIETNNKKSKFCLSLKQTAKLFILQWKTIFSSPIMLFMIFGFPLIFISGVGTLVPTSSLFSASFSLVILLIVGIVYGNLKYSIVLQHLETIQDWL